MILHINAKLNVWAEWVASGRKIVGLGYPSQCAFTRLTPSSGSWRAPIMHDEAYEIEQAIHALDPYLCETINQFYLRAGTADTHARELHISRDTLYVRLHHAHTRIMDLLHGKDCGDERLTGSDTFGKKQAN